MSAISDYLEELVAQKSALAANLTVMGVSASPSEKLNTLVPKVLDIESEPDLEALNVTENGTYTPSTGKDGFSEVIVDVEGGDLPNFELMNW